MIRGKISADTKAVNGSGITLSSFVKPKPLLFSVTFDFLGCNRFYQKIILGSQSTAEYRLHWDKVLDGSGIKTGVGPMADVFNAQYWKLSSWLNMMETSYFLTFKFN